MSDNPLAAQIKQLESRFDSFQDRVRMSTITREVSDVAERIKKLPAEIKQVRSRGYAYRSYLEQKAEVLGDHWDDIQHRVQRAIDSEIDDLRDDIQKVEFRVRRLNDDSDEGAVNTVSDVLENLETKIKAGETRIQNMYTALKNDVQSTFSQLTEINWFLDQKDEASFAFLAG
jgi:predicted  nucleic acid-binding Zn-ribbon protein